MPPDDERSNYRLAKESLLDHVATGKRAPHARRARPRGRAPTLYEQELGSLERFDLVLLGLGPDGHVASLYPEQPTLDETERRVVGAEAQLEPYVDRITLTLPTLRRAREVFFLVTGANKADAAYAAFAGEPTRGTPGSSCARPTARRSPCSTRRRPRSSRRRRLERVDRRGDRDDHLQPADRRLETDVVDLADDAVLAANARRSARRSVCGGSIASTSATSSSVRSVTSRALSAANSSRV